MRFFARSLPVLAVVFCAQIASVHAQDANTKEAAAPVEGTLPEPEKRLAPPLPALPQKEETPAQEALRASDSAAVRAEAEPVTAEQTEMTRTALESKTPEELDEMAQQAKRSKCPEVCKQDEACVHGRCLRACTPECRPGTTCKPNGSCIAPPVERDFRTEDELARISGAESADAKEAFILDPGGIFFLGANVAYERGARSAWIGRLQLMNTGLMSYTLEPQNEFERFEFGFGASLGYRRYETSFGNLRGFFFGGGLLGQALQVVDDDRNRVARTTVMLGTYGEFGYRWVFGNLLFGFGPNLSIRFPVGNAFSARGRNSCVEDNACPAPGAARFEGTLALEIGWLQ